VTYSDTRDKSKHQTLKLGLKASWLRKPVKALVDTFITAYNAKRPCDEHLDAAEVRAEGAAGEHVPCRRHLLDGRPA